MNFPPFITHKNKENNNKLINTLLKLLFKLTLKNMCLCEVFSWI